MKIRVMIAVCAAKFVGYVCKKMGRQGVTWAGKVAIKICPDILEQLSSQVRKAILQPAVQMERQLPTICSVRHWKRKDRK